MAGAVRRRRIGLRLGNHPGHLADPDRRGILDHAVVAVVIAIIVALVTVVAAALMMLLALRLLLFLAGAELVQHAIIMIGVLHVIFGRDAIALHARVARQLLVF